MKDDLMTDGQRIWQHRREAERLLGLDVISSDFGLDLCSTCGEDEDCLCHVDPLTNKKQISRC